MKKKKIIWIIIGVLLVITLLIVGIASIKTIPTGYVGVKTRFGKVQDDVLQEGLNTKVPL